MFKSLSKPLLVAILALVGFGVLMVLLPNNSYLIEYNKGLAAFEQRDFQKAKKHLEQATTANPKFMDAHLLTAKCGRHLAQYGYAEEHLQIYDELGGDSQIVKFERELRRVQEGDLKLAEQLLQSITATQLTPEMQEILEAVIKGYYGAANRIEAVKKLDQLLPTASNDYQRADWLYLRGTILFNIKRHLEAVDDLKAAIKLKPDLPQARKMLVTLLTRDEPKEALAHLDWLKANGHQDALINLEYARCHRFLGDNKQAVLLINELLTLRPDDTQVLTEAGALAHSMNRHADAERYLRKSLKLFPFQYEALVILSNCLKDTGNLAESQELAERAKIIEKQLEEIRIPKK